MKKQPIARFIQKIIQNEVFKYLLAGVLTTIFYAILRISIYPILNNATIAATVSNVLAIVFAFFINDTYVFNQARQGWQERFIKFFIARLSTLILDTGLAFLLVDQFPGIIGQFVNQNMAMVNAIATLIGQVLIMVTNYFISKFLIFKNKKWAFHQRSLFVLDEPLLTRQSDRICSIAGIQFGKDTGHVISDSPIG